MIGKRLIVSRPVTLEEVKDILKNRSEAGELTYEQTAASDYVKKFSKISLTKAKKLEEELRASLPQLPEEVAVKIVDMLPETAEKLRLIVPKTVKLEDDDVSKVLELVKNV